MRLIYTDVDGLSAATNWPPSPSPRSTASRSNAMLDRKEASEPTDFAEPGGLKSRADGSLLGGGGDVEEPNRGAFGRRREEHMSRRILILVIGAAAVIGCAITGRSAVKAGDPSVAIQVTDQQANAQPPAVPATGAPASSAAPAPGAAPAAGTAPAATVAPAVSPVAPRCAGHRVVADRRPRRIPAGLVRAIAHSDLTRRTCRRSRVIARSRSPGRRRARRPPCSSSASSTRGSASASRA